MNKIYGGILAITALALSASLSAMQQKKSTIQASDKKCFLQCVENMSDLRTPGMSDEVIKKYKFGNKKFIELLKVLDVVLVEMEKQIYLSNGVMILCEISKRALIVRKKIRKKILEKFFSKINMKTLDENLVRQLRYLAQNDCLVGNKILSIGFVEKS